MTLDPWQAFVLEAALAEDGDGRWAMYDFGLVVPRQNGKGTITEALELAHLFLFDTELVIHTAHEFKTARDAYRRVKNLITGCPELDAKVAFFHQSGSDTSIGLKDGRRLAFIARSSGSGRGLTEAGLVVVDEALDFTDDEAAALLSTTAAHPNPQVWYTSTPPPPGKGEVLGRFRTRALAGSGRSGYLEWSVDPEQATDAVEGWAEANPGLGVRLRLDVLEGLRGSMSDEAFRREHLGEWASGEVVDAVPGWERQTDPHSSMSGTVALAFDADPDGKSAIIAAAGRRSDGGLHVEIVEQREGIEWLPARLAELVAAHKPGAVWVNAGSLAASRLPIADVEVHEATTREVVRACAGLVVDIAEGNLWHRVDPVLDGAKKALIRRKVGDGYVWRGGGFADPSPMWAVTLARAAFLTMNDEPAGLLGAWA